jgi:ABC-2 type transport system permease protein
MYGQQYQSFVKLSGDFDNKIIHDAIVSGCSRGTVIVSKAMVLCCGIAFILLTYAIIVGIALSTGHKFSMGPVAFFQCDSIPLI